MANSIKMLHILPQSMTTNYLSSCFKGRFGLFKPMLMLVVLVLQACASNTSNDVTIVSDDQSTPQKQYSPLPKGSLEKILTAEIALRRQALEDALLLFADQTAETESLELAVTTAKLADYLGDTQISQAATEIWLEQKPEDAEAIEMHIKHLVADHDYLRAFEFIQNFSGAIRDEELIQLASAVARGIDPSAQQLIQNVYSETLAAQPNNVGLLVGLGLLTEEKNKIDALTLIHKANKIAPADPMISNIKAAVETEQGLFQNAVNTLDKALEYTPNHYGIMRHRASILAQYDIDAATEAYKQLYQQSDTDPKVLQPLAQLTIEQADYALATEVLNKLQTQQEFKDFSNYSLALIAEFEKRYFSAINYYQLVRHEPYLYGALRRFETLALQFNGIEEFEQHLGYLINDSQDYAKVDIAVYSSEYLLRQNRPHEANELVNALLTVWPDDSKLLYTAFLAQQSLGNYSEAVKPLEAMLSRFPENPTILNALGYTLSRYLGQHDRAKTLIESAHALSPQDPAIIDSMGWIKLQFGELDAAFHYFSDAYKLSENIDIAIHLAEALWLSHNRDQALDIFRKAWQQDASNIELLDTIQRLNIELK